MDVSDGSEPALNVPINLKPECHRMIFIELSVHNLYTVFVFVFLREQCTKVHFFHVLDRPCQLQKTVHGAKKKKKALSTEAVVDPMASALIQALNKTNQNLGSY